MSNIWKDNQNINENPNRNHFDLSFQNHLTMKMGYLYPIMCKEVVPGDTFKIDTAFGLKFMPLVFPVQSRMRAHVHYFYVRNKNIWSNWENFIQGLESHEHPFVDQPSSWFETGSLSDYLDVPTTRSSTTQTERSFMSISTGYCQDDIRPMRTIADSDGRVSVQRSTVSVENCGLIAYGCNSSFYTSPNGKLWRNEVDHGLGVSTSAEASLSFFDVISHPLYFYDYAIDKKINNSYYFYVDLSMPAPSTTISPRQGKIFMWREKKSSMKETYNRVEPFPNGGYYRSFGERVCVGGCEFSFAEQVVTSGVYQLTPTSTSDWDDLIQLCNYWINKDYNIYFSFCVPLTFDDSTVPYGYSGNWPVSHTSPNKDLFVIPLGTFKCMLDYDIVEEAPFKPFGNDVVKKVKFKISSLPFRAYESVYNAYYRDFRTQPFIVNGNEVFNQYNTTTGDGADSTNYTLFRRNYELDFLTSALPSPQFGAAPLVGMSALGTVTVTDSNGAVSTGQAELDSDGNITKIMVTSPLASVEHGRTFMNIAASGMSINDFRSVNALQRFLETCMRKGYKYRDFIAGHFGKEPEYRELDMPEFIGGTSEDVSVNLVTNMTSTDNSNPLGSFAGTANCFGGTRHTVEHYCDDYGFIIGIMCVVPAPAYSQNLPKHFLHQSQLDYYFTEFSQIGMQPIDYREVTPIQSMQDVIDDLTNTKTMVDTFGYQRPNYDLVGYTDQVHGDFRLSLRNFLINRIFGNRPELGSDFLEIRPEEVNDIFAYTDTASDTILGQIVCKIDAIRPVPRVVVPSLGR